MYLIGSSKTEESKLLVAASFDENSVSTLEDFFEVGLGGVLTDDTESSAADRSLEALAGSD